MISTTRFHYKVIGLPNVFVEGVDMRQEIDGEMVTVIPAVGRLHRAVAEAIVTRPWPLSGAELRFLRTELELCEDAGNFPKAVGVDLDNLLAIEQGDGALDPETEKRVRWLAVNELDLPVTAEQAFAKQGTRPRELPDIVIEPAESVRRYVVRPTKATEAGEGFDEMRETSGSRFARGEAVGVTESATPRVSAIRASWDTLRETLAWLTVPLASIPVHAAAGTRRAPGRAAAGASLSVDQISDQAPEGLQWVPARTHVPSPGQIEFILAWTGTGEAVAPTAVDLRRDGDPFDTAKITFDSYVGSLTIQLAGMDQVPKTIGLAQQEDGTLTLNLSEGD